MRKILYLSLALVIAFGAMLLAGNEDRIGTAGAQELRIPVGSRGSAMGGSLIANASGVEALYYNPAGTASQEGTQAMFSHLKYFADMNLDYVALTHNIEGFGTLGASVKVLSIGEFLKTTWNDQQGAAGEMIDPTFSVIGLSFARQFTDRVSFGMTGHFISEKVEQVSAQGIGLDFGFTYNPQWRGLKFGVAVKNLGPEMSFDGSDFEIDVIPDDADPNSTAKTVRTKNDAFELPSSVNFGVAWDMLNTNEQYDLEVSGTFQANNFSQDAFLGGVELRANDIFFLRAGYTASDQTEYIYGATFGGGIKLAWGASDILFDYSWVQNEFFDAHQYFTVKVAF